MSNYSSEASGVAASLSKMNFSEELSAYVLANKAVWATFGKMTSHLYREKLMKLMDSSSLTPECRFMVFFFFSVIKNQPRVLKAMNDLPMDIKSKAWFNPTRDFIAAQVVQYVTATNGNSKFPGVNIPTCNPGVDILVFCLITSPEEKTLDNVANRPTFSQLNLNEELQALAKIGYAFYWTNIVKGTRNTVKTDAPGMREEFYATSASDKYNLVGHDLKEIPPKDKKAGYTRKEIEDYFKKN